MYIAGPMRGHPRLNFDAFITAAAQLRDMGYEVLSPAEADLECGIDPDQVDEETLDMLSIIRRDVDLILRADVVALLPGWEASKGVAAELALAKWAGKRLFLYGVSDLFTLTPFFPAADKPAADEKPTNPKDQVGSGKLPVSLIPQTAMIAESLAMLEGALKYGAGNYRAIGVRASIYMDACFRHLMKWWNGEECDPVTQVPHLGSARACLGIILDTAALDMLTDDRPPANPGLCAGIDQAADKVSHLRQLFADRNPRHYTIQDSR